MERPNLGRFIHEQLLSLAMFFGRVNWANNEARALEYSPEQRKRVLMETHLAASARSRIIHSDWKQERYHDDQYFTLLQDDRNNQIFLSDIPYYHQLKLELDKV